MVTFLMRCGCWRLWRNEKGEGCGDMKCLRDRTNHRWMRCNRNQKLHAGSYKLRDDVCIFCGKFRFEVEAERKRKKRRGDG